jgi:predicted nucleotidyltransferase
MFARRVRNTPLDRLHARRAAARGVIVLRQAEQALAALKTHGTNAELVGSLARGQFRMNSDVDFLVDEPGTLTEGQIYGLISDHLRDAPFDVNFAWRMTPTALAVMRANARSRA